MPPVAGIDYSTKALHVGIVEGNTLLYAKAWDLGLDTRSKIGAYARAVEEMQGFGVQIIYGEDPWIRGDVGNYRTAITLHRIVHQFEAIAVAKGADFRTVAVASWRAAILGKGNLRTDAAKAQAIWYVKNVYGTELRDHNAADAICIATYAAAAAKYPSHQMPTAQRRKR